jgi:CRISPR/Cas system-associated endonuclease Cas1
LNSLLSLIYALCEVEGIRACHLVGIDAGMGLLHLDAKGRASMALDLVEVARPVADEFVLDLLEARPFAKRDFAEHPDGHVRLLVPLTHQVAEVMPRLGEAIAPVAEMVARRLGELITTDYRPTAPLSGANRKAAQRRVRSRKAAAEANRLRGTAARERPLQPRLDL